MFELLFAQGGNKSTIIHPILTHQFTDYCSRLATNVQTWFSTSQFKAKSGQVCIVPSPSGEVQAVYVGLEEVHDVWVFGKLPKTLPQADYMLDDVLFNKEQRERIFLVWGLGGYTFDRYKKSEHSLARLVITDQSAHNRVEHMLQSYYLARDLINTPAQDLRPTRYAERITEVLKPFAAKCRIVKGKKLEDEFPGVYAVGKAGEEPPCLVDVTWGHTSDPKVTLVGKGICFDSGGLDLKPAAGMREMKKDMAGSAIALAVARLIMAQKLPLRLRLILPLAENAVSSNSFRPGDVLTMRSGKTVEVDNTDAEGRLVLADALTLACEEKPDYLIDVATLTGAARIAMGPDIPAFFSNNDQLASALEHSARQSYEVISRLPLYKPYLDFIKSDIADLSNAASSPLGGAITAALFLQEFVGKDIPWAHFDVMAMNTRDLPGRPKGAEASAFATVYHFIEGLVQH